MKWASCASARKLYIHFPCYVILKLWERQLHELSFASKVHSAELKEKRFMQTNFILIKFNISWDDVLSASKFFTGNHFEQYHSIRWLRREREMNIAKISFSILHVEWNIKFSCWILFSLEHALGGLRIRREAQLSGKRNRLRKLWCSWDNKNNIKISKLMPWHPLGSFLLTPWPFQLYSTHFN